ncbi:uncharacterized protein LOC110714251 [Chenopodium quinoa]|uniref:uncharacterized protein LOC110714251 n=1 Tax=Chenopodium quinoa TaxID=63459 RepID=UPI000B7706CF|nr:uncharacterized protein LOC110714251 [Chenopodium quinoa]
MYNNIPLVNQDVRGNLEDEESEDEENIREEVDEDATIEEEQQPQTEEKLQELLQEAEQLTPVEFTDLPVDKKALDSKWVYKVKFDRNEKVVRLKESQNLIALATVQNWKLHQLDNNNAFLHGFIDEDIYLKPPQGYTKAPKGKSTRDYSMFSRVRNGKQTIVLVYVDDLLITGDDDDYVSIFKKQLDEEFTIKDLGEMRYFLGLEVSNTCKGTLLNQRKYVLDVSEYTRLSNCKPATAPCPKHVKLSTHEGTILSDPEKYRSLIGKLLYLNLSRPDFSFSVQQLSQFMSCPRESHWDAALHVVKYLKGTSDWGLFYQNNLELREIGYSDADNGSCVFIGRSLTGYCFSWRKLGLMED